jgi:hypothetical protein
VRREGLGRINRLLQLSHVAGGSVEQAQSLTALGILHQKTRTPKRKWKLLDSELELVLLDSSLDL